VSVVGYYDTEYIVRGFPMSALPPVWVGVENTTFNHHDYLTTEQAREYAGQLLAAAIQVETARGTE
jgi:hypothetical protein